LDTRCDFSNRDYRNLREHVDHWIIGSMQYHGVLRCFYAGHLPELIAWLDDREIKYYLKKELKSCLPPEEKPAVKK